MGFIFDCLHPNLNRTCPVCGKSFRGKQKHQIYCCFECSRKDTHDKDERRIGKGNSWVEKHWQRSCSRNICPMCGVLTANNLGCCRNHQAARMKEIWDYGTREAEELIRRGFCIDLSESEGAERQLYERLISANSKELEIRKLIKSLKRRLNQLTVDERYSTRLCRCCGNEFIPKAAHQVFCTKKCAWKAYTLTEKGRALHNASKNNRQRCRKFGVKYESGINSLDVFERDHWICQLCFRKLSKKNVGKLIGDAPTIDHIRPLSRGGGHTWNNVQCACRQCNLQKSNGVNHSMFDLF